MVSEEEILVKPRAPSVARSTRGRRPKAQLPPAVVPDAAWGTLAEETWAGEAVTPNLLPIGTTGVRIWSLVRIGGLVCTFLYLFGLVVHCAPRMHMNRHAAQPRDLSFNGQCGTFEEVILWFNDKMPWTQRVGGTEERRTALNRCQILEGGGIRQNNTHCVCPPCSACIDRPVCNDDPRFTAGRIRGPIKLPLPPLLSKYPAVSDPIHQTLEILYEVTLNHPWGFLLLLIFAAWKASELLLRVSKIAMLYVLQIADQAVIRMGHEDGQVVKMDLDDGSERARKEAEQKLLLRMSGIVDEGEHEPPVESLAP